MQNVATVLPRSMLFRELSIDALLHQLGDAVAQKLRVDAEMLLVAEVREDRVREASVSDLDRVAVLDDAGDVLPDLLGDLTGNGRLVLQERFVVVDDEVDVVDVDERVAVHAGHVGVGLRDDGGRDSVAAFVMSTVTPRLMKPCSSGSDV